MSRKPREENQLEGLLPRRSRTEHSGTLTGLCALWLGVLQIDVVIVWVPTYGKLRGAVNVALEHVTQFTLWQSSFKTIFALYLNEKHCLPRGSLD